MTTKRRAEANRRNAMQSTGPRTGAGKAVARLNALRHGLTARAILLPGEDPAELDAFAEGVRAALAPVGTVEELLAERVVLIAWRLARVAAVDAGFYARTILGRARRQANAEASAAGRTVDPLTDIFRESAPRFEVTDAARHAAALRRVAEATAAQDTGGAGLAETWAARDGAGAVMFERLARYEGTLSRELLRALYELERMQARRASALAPSPDAAVVRQSAGDPIPANGSVGTPR